MFSKTFFYISMLLLLAACGGGGGGGGGGTITQPVTYSDIQYWQRDTLRREYNINLTSSSLQAESRADAKQQLEMLRNGATLTDAQFNEILTILGREATENDCLNSGQQWRILIGGCRAPTSTECIQSGLRLNTENNQVCRMPTMQECENINMVLDNGICREVREADCDSNMVFVSNRCVAPSDASCRSKMQRFDSGTNRCRIPTEQECRAENMVLLNSMCMAINVDNCNHAGLVFDNTNMDNPVCRPPLQVECSVKEPYMVLENNRCVAPNADRCRNVGLEFDNTMNKCRDFTQSECTGIGRQLIDNLCIAPSDAECSRFGRAFDSTSSMCRTPTAQECIDDDKILIGSLCGQPTEQQCEMRSERLDYEQGKCRPLNADDCIRARQMINPAGTACIAPTAQECIRRNQTLDTNNNTCRQPNEMECMARNKRFDMTTTNCRAPTSMECESEFRVLIGGECGAPTEEQCAARSDAHIKLGAGRCRVPTEQECRDEKLAFNPFSMRCEAPTEEECRSRGERLDDSGNKCRELISSDCAEVGRVLKSDGTCGQFTCERLGMVVGNNNECVPNAAAEMNRSGRNLTIIHAEYAYEKGYFGQGVTIGISDLVGFSGLSVSLMNGFHPDLTLNYVDIPNLEPVPTDSPDHKDVPNSAHWHGLAVAGVAVAASNSIGIIGVAPQAKWTFRNHISSGNWFTTYGDKVQVVNLSYLSFASWFFNPTLANAQYRGKAITTYEFISTVVYDRNIQPTVVYKYRVPSGFSLFMDSTVSWPHYDRTVNASKKVTIKGTIKEYLTRYADSVKDTDTIFVWSAGNDFFHRGNDVFDDVRNMPDRRSFWTDDFWGLIPYTVSIPTIDSLAPKFQPDLRDNWLVAVAFDEIRYLDKNLLATYSNGCGEAMMWCLAAPGTATSSFFYRAVDSRTDAYGPVAGTSFSAPYISGALALIKSAAPSVPMTVIHGIILTTATDLCRDPNPLDRSKCNDGVDDVFGWGLVNVSAAIVAVTSMKTAETSNFAAVNYRDLELRLPQKLSHVADKLDDSVAVAINVTNDLYFNMPLSRMVKTPAINNNEPATTPALHDLDSSLAKYADDNYSALPFFVRDGGGGMLLQERVEGLRPFFSFDANGDIRDSGYQQLGFRWQKTQERFGIVAELSHINERETFWGADFGALGDMSAQTEQAKLLLSGELSGGWSGFAGVEHARARTNLSNGQQFIIGIEDAAASGWMAGVEGHSIFTHSDKLRLLAKQKTRISGGGLVLETPQVEGGFTEAFYGEIEQKLDVRRSLIPLREESSVIWGLGYGTNLGKAEWSAAIEHDDGHHKTSLSAQWQYAF